MLLKSTTRHIHIYAGEVINDEICADNENLTLNIDPDSELDWNEPALNQVQEKFQELVSSYNGEDLTEYNLRRIGSDLEHYVRSLLLTGKIGYNTQARVQNYSLGVPRMADS
ncbi:NAD(P)H-quinone oxidoreductase subunit M [Candidatus Synechococcus calcipolaris G9]|uniref:NAD(P)H-quinone oxidoreductase subunit M n=1 Tax=Candidatus Synechococcus calcipolaris G9 TaxID=1497997 RepID=A0ABT6F2Y8_9SYNE|nr:NAD(P)H-quinone oxidoreductase subunit M [Candidatus Synechococcus calcipolaris G9]